MKAVTGQSTRVAENDQARKQWALDCPLARDKDLATLLERLHEDNVSGKIDDARSVKISKRYEAEQGESVQKIKALRLELKKIDGKKMNVDMFFAAIRRYTDAKQITRRMAAEFTDHIDVYHAEKEDGITTPRVTIFYNCITFDVPDCRNISEIDIPMETRKGVAVSYARQEPYDTHLNIKKQSGRVRTCGLMVPRCL